MEKEITLIGRTIVEFRELNEQEKINLGWSGEYGGIIIILDDGTKLIPSSDDEGNSPGVLFVD